MTSGQVLEIENNGTVTDSFDYAGNLNLGVSGGTAALAPTIYFNAASSSTAHQASISVPTGEPGTLTFTSPGTSGYVFYDALVGSTLNYGTLTLSGTYGFVETNTNDPLILRSNILTDGPTVILSSVATLTGGLFVNLINGAVASIASFDYAGNLNLGEIGGTATLSPTLYFNSASSSTAHQSTITGTSTGAITLTGNGSGGQAVVVAGTGNFDVTATGGSNINGFGFSTNGHAFSSTYASPTVGSFDPCLGTVTGVTVTGGDTAFIVTFTTGSTTTLGPSSNNIFVVTLGASYGNTKYVVMATSANLTTINYSLYLQQPIAYPLTGQTIQVIVTAQYAAYAPSTTYAYAFTTCGAGATGPT
jgi:hypothetical protein